MSFLWQPFPHIGLSDGSDGTELALNVTAYAMALGITGALLWLITLAWFDRAK